MAKPASAACGRSPRSSSDSARRSARVIPGAATPARRADGRRGLRIGAVLRTLRAPLQRQGRQARRLLLLERRHEHRRVRRWQPRRALRTIFHEYVHLVIDNVSEGMPLWLNEGLAEYYSTFQVDDGGRRALIGQAIPAHLQLLDRPAPLPDSGTARRRRRLAVLQRGRAPDRSSTRSRGRSCTCSSPARRIARTLLGQYGRLVAGGTPSLDAWQQVFKDAEHHPPSSNVTLAATTMSGFLYRFNQTIPTVKSYSSRVSEGDVAGGAGRSPAARRPGARNQRAVREGDRAANHCRHGRARSMGCSCSTRTNPTRRCPS